MSPAPARPKIYHITHVDTLASIIADGMLISDREIANRGGPPVVIGMSTIKARRLTLPVGCHSGTMVGDYVPFYFCPRSVMLYLIYCANHPELKYRGGQDPIVHLEADLQRVVDWADRSGRRWCFSLSNAGAFYTPFRASLGQLHEINWDAVGAKDWRQDEFKEGKQAEFLVHESFPWTLIEGIGVISPDFKVRTEKILAGAQHRPPVEIRTDWYY